MKNRRLNKFKKNIDAYIKQFDGKKYNLALYNQVINSPALTAKQIKSILCWKLRGNLKYEQLTLRHRALINRAIEKLNDINNFKKKHIAKSLFNRTLEHISPNGPIIKIFLLHICRPKEYELFDQHVFRAFYHIKTGKIYAGSVTFLIADTCYPAYQSFFKKLCSVFKDKYKSKEIDGALMVYGKELKGSLENSNAKYVLKKSNLLC